MASIVSHAMTLHVHAKNRWYCRPRPSHMHVPFDALTQMHVVFNASRVVAEHRAELRVPKRRAAASLARAAWLTMQAT